MSKARTQKPVRNPRRRPRKRSAGKSRWLLLPLVLGIAALAVYVVVTLGPTRFATGGSPPLDDISDASRRQLERVIRDAEQAEGRR